MESVISASGFDSLFAIWNWDPAWVQAVGSLLALAVAVGVAWWHARHTKKMINNQRDRENENEKQRRISSLRAAAQAAEVVADRIIKMHQVYPHLWVQGLLPQSIDTMRTAVMWLDRLPIHEMPVAIIAKPVLNLRLQAERMIHALEIVLKENDYTDLANSLVARMEQLVVALKEDISATADSYDGDLTLIRAVDL